MSDDKNKVGSKSPLRGTGGFKIAVIPGDGIGPEVTQQSVKIFFATGGMLIMTTPIIKKTLC